MRQTGSASAPRLLIIIPRSHAVEGVASLGGLGGQLEMIIDRRISERRCRPAAAPAAERRRRGERRRRTPEHGAVILTP